MKIFLIFVSSLFLHSIQLTRTQTCPDLNVGTMGGTETIPNDIIRKGEPTSHWNFQSQSPIIVVVSKALQYFYVSDLKTELSDKDVNISWAPYDHASTNVAVKKEGNGYALVVTYNCIEDQGGVLLALNMTINVPQCGSSTFSWKKVCGNPLQPKMGLTVQLRFHDLQTDVIKDGKRTSITMFNHLVSDWELVLQHHVNSATFRAYINMTGTPPENSIVPLRSIPQVRLGTPEVDSDEDIVTVGIRGNGTTGGLVSESIYLDYELDFTCHASGTSHVEFIIRVDFFHDIVMIFSKNCEVVGLVSILIRWLIVLAIIWFIYLTYLNIAVYDKSGLDAIPGYDQTRKTWGDVMNKLDDNYGWNLSSRWNGDGQRAAPGENRNGQNARSGVQYGSLI